MRALRRFWWPDLPMLRDALDQASCRRVQHPVGHGFFHSAHYEHGGQRVRWIYDCGSIAGTGERDRAIDRYRRRLEADGAAAVDLLVISHAHADHINGLPRLFADGLHPDVVVIPALSNEERLVALVQSHLEGAGVGGSPFVADFADDDVRAVLRLGARLVVRVRGVRDDDLGEVLTQVDRPDLGEVPLDGLGLALDSTAGVTERSVDGHRVLTVPDDRALVLGALPRPHTSRAALWRFVPHIDRADPQRASEFASRLADTDEWGAVPGPRNADRVLQVLERAPGLVQHLYKQIFGSSVNATSLSIYAGPDLLQNADSWADRWTATADAPPSREVGWLATGDAELGEEQEGQARCDRFLAKYRPFASAIGTLAAPHHGSRHNWSPRLLDELRPDVVVVCVGHRRWRMPCDALVADVAERGVLLYEVGRDPRTVLHEAVFDLEALLA